MKMSKQKVMCLIGLFVAVLAFSSCAAPTYLPCPILQYPTIENKCTFGVQNMDNVAKVEEKALTCHYEGFDVTYKISNDFVISLEIINNTNKSLIIDKSKCFVLYNGYSTQLFKDVRSSRSTTFNNVQDAINNVQTNDASISMMIPPYSKWELPLEESNIREIKTLPDFKTSLGVHTVTPYENKETVEFVIPYSFDYTMAKWDTSRNRIYVNSIEVKNGFSTSAITSGIPGWISNTQYIVTRRNGDPDYTEANRIDALNRKKYKNHKTEVIIADIVCIPFTFLWSLVGICAGGCYNIEHRPPVYGNGSSY